MVSAQRMDMKMRHSHVQLRVQDPYILISSMRAGRESGPPAEPSLLRGSGFASGLAKQRSEVSEHRGSPFQV